MNAGCVGKEQMPRQIEIIAEIGVNHNGDMQVATDLIWQCKRAGADVAKFQLYDPRKRPNINEHRWKDVLLKSRLTKRQVMQLAMECKKADIEFMASCFDIERVGWCELVGVKRYKIASKSIYDEELAEAIAKTGKPVIVSRGMVDQKIGSPSIERIKQGNIYELYCISKYPARWEDLSFKVISKGGGFWELVYAGFSDHTFGITASIVAMGLGAKIIEKHVTLSKTMPGPDHFFSLLPEELAELCRHRDIVERILK